MVDPNKITLMLWLVVGVLHDTHLHIIQNLNTLEECRLQGVRQSAVNGNISG